MSSRYFTNISTITSAFPYNILADALIIANHVIKLNGDKSMAELTENINDYTDEYIDTIIKLAEANTIADDLLAGFNRVQEYLHSLYDAVWAAVKASELLKNENTYEKTFILNLDFICVGNFDLCGRHC